MATALMNVYHAFRSAGVSEDQAQKAAEELAGYENRFAKLETDMATVKWMLGVVIALVLAVLGILLRAAVH